MKSIKLIKSSSFDEIEKVIQEALKLGTDNNFGHNWHTDALKRFEFINRNPISTGWGRMDEIIKGGLGKSELGVVIAPTGAGKSMVLVHLAAEALKAGKTVVYYTLELKDTVVGGRFDSNISGIPLSELKTRKEEVLAEIENVDGSLIIKEYPTKSASVQTIKNHIEKLKKRGIYPDMVLVDYADLLRPDRTTGEKRHELEETYSISEAFNKCFVADFIFSLSRTVQDKQSNKGRIFVAKNRNGPDGLVFPCFVDWSDVTIKVLSRDDNDAEMPSTTDALQVLRKKYSELSAK
jgi:replicative DNA helicase